MKILQVNQFSVGQTVTVTHTTAMDKEAGLSVGDNITIAMFSEAGEIVVKTAHQGDYRLSVGRVA